MVTKSDEDFEASAVRLRKLVGINDRFMPDVIFVLNELKRMGEIADYGHMRDDLLEDDASYDASNRILMMRDSVWNALDHPNREGKMARRRARFAVAHDWGISPNPMRGRTIAGQQARERKQSPSRRELTREKEIVSLGRF
jgi:hypothetical protein